MTQYTSVASAISIGMPAFLLLDPKVADAATNRSSDFSTIGPPVDEE